jgi:hypothetical protein
MDRLQLRTEFHGNTTPPSTGPLTKVTMALRATTHEKECLPPRPPSPQGFSGETNPPENSVGRGAGG